MIIKKNISQKKTKVDPFQINKIKVKAGNIGYIGDKNSATYQQLIDAGLQDGRDFD